MPPRSKCATSASAKRAPAASASASPQTTYLSQRGYAIDKNDANVALIEQLKATLTVKPRTNPSAPGADVVQPFPVYQESSKKLYMPRVFGFETFGPPKVDTLHSGCDAPRLQFLGTLRPEQQAPVDAFMEAAVDPSRMGGIISLQCAGGKTVLALYVAAALKKKTLVICHKEFLLNQWKERIGQFLPNAKIGVIKAKKLETEDCDIVLASLQSIAMKTYPSSVFQEFGLVVSDECHHLSAEVFSQALPKVTARVFLGLSATLDRKDGLRKVFEWYLGKPVFQNKKRTESQMIVKMVPYFDINPEYSKERLMWNGKRNVAQTLSAICNHAPRNKVILDELEMVLKKEPARRVLVLSDRRGHLKELERCILERKLGTVGYYVGGMKEQELKASESKDIILATLAMSAEGMDIPALDTLVLASPVSAIEQPIGRIQRQKPCERKHIPLTIDIWDEFSLYLNQGRRRLQFYKKNGYDVGGQNAKKGETEAEDEGEDSNHSSNKEPDFESDSDTEA